MQKVALITGCSSGIGKSTALSLARDGIYTFASMRDTSKGGQLSEIVKKEGLPLEIIELDVTDSHTIDNVFQKILFSANIFSSFFIFRFNGLLNHLI